MKLIYQSTLLATVLFLSIATTLRSGPAECLATPSQDCIFKLAIEAAEEETNPHYWAAGMMHIAFLQESVGSEKSGETLAYFIENLPNRMPNPRTIAFALWIRPANSLQKSLPDAPQASQEISSLLLNLAPQLDDKGEKAAIGTAAAYLVYTPQKRQIYDLIEQMDQDHRPDVINAVVRGLIALGDVEMLQKLFDLIPDPDMLSKTKAIAVVHLTRNGDYDTAKRIASSVVTVRVRVAAYITIMHSYVRNQHYNEARRIAQYLQESYEIDDVLGLRWALERTYSDIGDDVKLRALFQTRSSNAGNSGRDELLATAAMMQGDLGPIFDYMELSQQQKSASSSYLLNRYVVRDYLRSGQTDLTRFIEYFGRNHLNDRSPQDVFSRLEFLAEKQAEQGDLDGAQMTFWRADFVLEKMMNEEQVQKFYRQRFAIQQRSAFERLLVERGMIKEALASAYERRNAVALADLATMID